MIHAEAEELLAAGAVLDDLEPDERIAYDAHRATCLVCRRLEVELDHVLADLALAVPDRVPPPDLLAGIRRAIDLEAGAGRATVAAAPSPTLMPIPAQAPAPVAIPRRSASRAPLFAALGLAAAFGIVAVGLGVRGAGLQRDLDASVALAAGLQADMAANEAVMSTAMAPDRQIVVLQAEAMAPTANAAVIYVPGSTAAWIVAEHLPATQPGTGYQLWYADAAGVHGLQTVAFDGNGPFMAPMDVDLAAGTAVMITLEAAGGATGDPGPQVVFGSI